MKNKFAKYLSILLLFLFSCKKEKITESHSEFIGSWIHYTDQNDYHTISIENDSRGWMEWYKDGNFDTDTKSRKFFIKNDFLLFGHISTGSDKMKINLYPSFSTSMVVYEFDTVQIGEMYMKLDNKIYRKL